MTAHTKPFNIAIVGGGIAGLTLAIALLKKNVPFTIYEAARHFGEIGAGVAFGPNAVRAMELIDPAMLEGFEKVSTENISPSNKGYWFTVRVGDARKADAEGNVQTKDKKFRVGDKWFNIEFMNASGAKGGVHRAHFLDEMVKLVPDHVVRFGHRLKDITNATDGSGNVVLTFADGQTVEHSAVIGCDGIKSRTREILLGKDDPAARAVFSGKYAYRGLIPMDKAIEMVGEERALNSQFYFGYHGHVLTFPIDKGRIFNVVAFRSRETWDDPNWVVHTSKEDLLNDFAGWGPVVEPIIEAMQKPDIWALFNHPPAKTFYNSRLCLLGDAAHATTPHQGSGAGMCVEDAYILANLVAEASSVSDLERAFAAYDEVRRPRTQKLVTTSYEAGRIYEFEALGDDLDAIEDNLMKRMHWIWGIDLPSQLEEAKKAFQRTSAKV